MSDRAEPLAIRCQAVGKRFLREDVVPYHGLRSKLHGLLHGAWRQNRSSGEDAVWALRDVTFEAPAGVILGVLGGNGSGKSVLLKILARVTKPTSGRSEVYGSVNSILHLGAMLIPELTGRENIYQTGILLRLQRITIDRHFDEIVHFAGIETHLDSVVRGYSAGMQLRLAFAVMAYLESDVLLIDEALSVADEEFRARCVRRIGQMAREGRTIVLVSHDLEMMADLCDQTLVLDHSRLSAFGTARPVIAAYRQQIRTDVVLS